jgi:hypothetical protein
METSEGFRECQSQEGEFFYAWSHSCRGCRTEQRLRPFVFGNSSKCRQNTPIQKEAQQSSNQAEEEIWTIGFPRPGSSRRVHRAGEIMSRQILPRIVDIRWIGRKLHEV